MELKETIFATKTGKGKLFTEQLKINFFILLNS